MCTLVQLEDGSYRLIIDIKDEGFSAHSEYHFVESKPSDAKVVKTIFTISAKK